MYGLGFFGTKACQPMVDTCVNHRFTYGVVDEIIQAKQAVDLARARLEDAVHATSRSGPLVERDRHPARNVTSGPSSGSGRPADPRNGDPMTTRTITGLIEATEATFRLIADGSHDELQARLNPGCASS